MYRVFANCVRPWSVISVFLVLVFAYSSASFAQEKPVTKTAGVDDSAMGAYRALAELSFEAFQRGDKATAAELARVLECTWDKGEKDLRKTKPQVWSWIDESMDRYIKPIIGFGYGEKAPEPVVVEAAYEEYLVELKLTD